MVFRTLPKKITIYGEERLTTGMCTWETPEAITHDELVRLCTYCRGDQTEDRAIRSAETRHATCYEIRSWSSDEDFNDL
jgi:hypothetical protein